MIYRTELDGIRAIAVLAVILAHAGVPGLAGGYVGVDIFFVLSGYLIGGLILRDLEGGNFSFARFYQRRARRILPALFLVLTLSWPMAWWLMTPSELEDFAPGVLSSILFVSNIYFWDVTGYFSPLSETLPLLHTWSLSIEEQYYLFFPLFAIASFRLARATGFIAMVALLAMLSLALAEWGVRNEPEINYFFTFSRIWEILAGTLCLWVERRWQPKGADIPAGLGLMAILLTVVAFDATTPFPSLYGLLPIGGTVLLLLFARAGTRTMRFLSLKTLSIVGLISYSAYLFHQPVFAFARIGFNRNALGWLAIPLIALVLALAWLSWKFVEQPFRRGGNQWQLSTRGAGILATSAALTFGAVSVATYFSDIALYRYAPIDRPLFEITRREALSYMRRRAAHYRGKPFDNDGRPRVFIIGDSYSSDFVNMLGEHGLLDRLDLSIHAIPSQCGNLMLAPDAAFPPYPLPVSCKSVQRYNTPSVQARLKAADLVFLVSYWQEPFVPYLANSLENIRTATNGEVLLLGTKNFGDVDPEILLDVPQSERPFVRTPAHEGQVTTNDRMAALDLPGFIDLQRLICEPDGRACPITAPDGRLISVDGRHLTRSGARHVGDMLLSDPRLRALLGG